MLEKVLVERPSKPGGTEMNQSYWLLVPTDGINLIGKNIHSTQKNIEALLGASMDDELEVTAEKTK
jgi:hypothetical protein